MPTKHDNDSESTGRLPQEINLGEEFKTPEDVEAARARALARMQAEAQERAVEKGPAQKEAEEMADRRREREEKALKEKADAEKEAEESEDEDVEPGPTGDFVVVDGKVMAEDEFRASLSPEPVVVEEETKHAMHGTLKVDDAKRAEEVARFESSEEAPVRQGERPPFGAKDPNGPEVEVLKLDRDGSKNKQKEMAVPASGDEDKAEQAKPKDRGTEIPQPGAVDKAEVIPGSIDSNRDGSESMVGGKEQDVDALPTDEGRAINDMNSEGPASSGTQGSSVRTSTSKSAVSKGSTSSEAVTPTKPSGSPKE